TLISSFGALVSRLIPPLSLHDALPISVPLLDGRRADPLRLHHGLLRHAGAAQRLVAVGERPAGRSRAEPARHGPRLPPHLRPGRSEEHTSELQSRENLVCRLLLEKKKT